MQKSFFFSVLTFVLGSIFIFSGYVKLFPIEPFELNFVEQGFLNWTLAPFASRILIALEMFLGIAIILQLQVKFTLKAIMYLLVFFTIYLIYAIAKEGNNGNCGCFGTYLQMTPLQSIIKNVILLALTFFLFKTTNEKQNFSKNNLIITLLAALILPIIFYFNLITFFTFQLNFIVVESILIMVLILLLITIKYNSKALYKLLYIVVGVASLSLPFALNPPDLFVIDTYDFGKLNYPLNADKLNDFATKKVDANWQKGKKIIAFLSLTCPHCRDMAFKLHIIKKHHTQLNILFVYGGAEVDKPKFLMRAKCADMPAISMSIDEMVKISGPLFPTVVGLNNGTVLKKWTILSMTEQEAITFLY